MMDALHFSLLGGGGDFSMLMKSRLCLTLHALRRVHSAVELLIRSEVVSLPLKLNGVIFAVATSEKLYLFALKSVGCNNV